MEIASSEVNGCSDRMMYPGAREGEDLPFCYFTCKSCG